MNTIKVDKKFNKVQIKLPNNKKYWARSADVLKIKEKYISVEPTTNHNN